MQLHWIYDPVISFEELLLYHNAISYHSDSFYYHPVAVAKRHETGVRYRFLCIINPKGFPEGPTHFAITELYKPDQGMPYVTRVIPLTDEPWV